MPTQTPPSQERTPIPNFFVNATGCSTPEEWIKRIQATKTKTLKRKALGLCGRETIKNIDEMAKLLYETGITHSLELSRELVPHLTGRRAYYAPGKELLFDDWGIDQNGKRLYKITKYVTDIIGC